MYNMDIDIYIYVKCLPLSLCIYLISVDSYTCLELGIELRVSQKSVFLSRISLTIYLYIYTHRERKRERERERERSNL